MNSLNSCSTYSLDSELFRDLGLKPFKDIPLHKEHYVGKVKYEKSHVEIWVTGTPAQFWQFVIYSEDANKQWEVATGSGALQDYWHSVELMMKGFLVVK